MTKNEYWVYILYCDNDSYYTGYTTNLTKRYQSHLCGKGSKYTRSFKPLALKAAWKIADGKSAAMKLEHAIKKLSRVEKEKLIRLYSENILPVIPSTAEDSLDHCDKMKTPGLRSV